MYSNCLLERGVMVHFWGEIVYFMNNRDRVNQKISSNYPKSYVLAKLL